MPRFISAMEGYRKTPDSIPVDDNKVLLNGYKLIIVKILKSQAE